MRLLVIGGSGFAGCNFIRYVLGHYHAEFITNVTIESAPGNPENLNGLRELYPDRYESLTVENDSADHLRDVFAKHRYFAVLRFDRGDGASPLASLCELAAEFHVKRVIEICSAPVSKLDAELESAAAKGDAEVAALVCSCAIGENQWALERFPTWIRRVLENVPVLQDEGPDSARDWLHAADFCSAIMAVTLEGASGAKYFAGPDYAVPDEVMADWICRAVAREEISDWPNPGDFPTARTDSSRLREELEWHPIVPIREAVRDVVYWFLRYRARLLP